MVETAGIEPATIFISKIAKSNNYSIVACHGIHTQLRPKSIFFH